MVEEKVNWKPHRRDILFGGEARFTNWVSLHRLNLGEGKIFPGLLVLWFKSMSMCWESSLVTVPSPNP